MLTTLKMKIEKKYKIIVIVLVSISLISFVVFVKFRETALQPNVILITIDALRPDHLGCYGYQRDTSPNIDKLAKEGIVFLNCFSTGPNTVYSLGGFVTGRYLEIGEEHVFLDNILDMKFTTLAEYLKSMDYYTAAFVNNVNLKIGKGFEQGFDYYDNLSYRLWDAEEITTSVLNFLNGYKYKKPFFVWIHYLEPHAPYDIAPRYFREEYFKNFEKDRLYKKNDKELRLKPDIFESQNKPYYLRSSEGYIPLIVFRNNKYNLNYYIACYDTEIVYVDSHIGRLLKKIDSNTIIILSADHGESLGEHNSYFNHGENIYDEELHIPLIIKDNRYFKGGKKVSTVVSSVDIVPTILSRINPLWVFFNKLKFDGEDLRISINGKNTKRKYIYSYFPRARSIRDIDKNIKYILNDDGREELYLLPNEYANHINDGSLAITLVRKELEDSLRKWLKDYPIRADINPKKAYLDRATKNNLRNLGYLQ